MAILVHDVTDDLLFIFWRAHVTLGERALDWTGVDRFRLRDGRAIEEVVTFDTQLLRDALAAPRRQATIT
jgi:hypothetical protein